ncbi:hypothetical protein T8S45_01500 [Blastomonas marina]|uniref:hypothetical protein n=1 Tax=Blastomonas marina TaxID=1867408 RepID=UPI002AC9BE60|nr:hypothetical protein [Blastomonas marina]WPZ04234.1 hypothetical protein T8S45_01500 [Blastomonas marina]
MLQEKKASNPMNGFVKAIGIFVFTFLLTIAVLSSFGASMTTTLALTAFTQSGLVASAMYVRSKAEADSQKKSVATWVMIISGFWAVMSLVAFVRA